MRPLVLALFFLSGALGLLYEVVWLRLLVLTFGSTHFATTAILAAFMSGLALGSFLLGRYVDRAARSPLAIYGLLEVALGLYALAVPALLKLLEPLSVLLWERAQPGFFAASLLRFLFALLILLPPTTLMGGTLPVLSRLAAASREGIGGAVGKLYAVNTLGAVAGTALTGFTLIPTLGVRATILLAAAANVVVGIAAFVLSRRSAPAGPEETAAPREGGSPPRKSIGAGRGVLYLAAGTGFLALVYEIAWTRILTLVLGSSVYAFTVMLATFLTGIALGGFAGARLASRARDDRSTAALLAASIALMAAGGYATMQLLPRLPSLFASAFHFLGLALAGSFERGAGAAPRLVLLEFALAMLLMLPATLFSGIVFPLAVRLRSNAGAGAGATVGAVYASNTAGTILGAVLGGFVLLPLTGLQGGILSAVAAGLVLAGAAFGLVPGLSPGRRFAAVAAGTLLAAFAVATRPAWDPLVMNSGVFQYARELGARDRTAEGFRQTARRGLELISYEEGMTASVMVVKESPSGNIWLAVNGKIDASSHRDIATQILLGHLPMLHRAPGGGAEGRGARVAVIGHGSGMTAGAITRHDPAEILTLEIEPAVLRASRAFDAYTHAPLSDPRHRVVEADGRNFLLISPEKWDVIVSEPSNPWMTVAANLFTREFFETGRRRLAPGGLFCQWVQLYGLGTESLRSLVRTFAATFPHVAIYQPIAATDLILLGSDLPVVADLEALERALGSKEVREDLARIGISTPWDLLTYRLLGDREARAFAGDGPFNTDDNALIEFATPFTLHAETRARNQAALDAHAADPLSLARGLPEEPTARAEAYVSLGEAFLRRGLPSRALAALSVARGLDGAARRLEELQLRAEKESSRPAPAGIP